MSNHTYTYYIHVFSQLEVGRSSDIFSQTLDVVITDVTHSDWGVHFSYQLCCCTKRKATTWKTRQVRIWARTEKSSGAEIRLDGGRRRTSSFHAGFRLTDDREEQHHFSGDLITWFPGTQATDNYGRVFSWSCCSLVKAMMRMMAMSMKRNWKSPKLLRICNIRKVD